MPKPKKQPVVYVDTCVYMDLLIRNNDQHADTGEPRWKIAKALFDAVESGRIALAASALTEAEVGCLGVVRDGGDEVVQMVRTWFVAPDTVWTDVDRFLARDGATLAREWNARRANPKAKLGGADAAHLAAAVRLKSNFLMTHDGGFPIGHTVKGVQVVRPTQVWDADLFDTLESDRPE